MGALLAPGAAGAATFTPTKVSDDNSVNGNCTLREAVRAANGDVAVDACPAGTGADTIQLEAGVYPIQLTGSENAALTGDFDITDADDLTIVGAAEGTTINGLGVDRVFEVFGDGVVLTIDRVTIRGGAAPNYGGAISTVNGGTTNLMHSTLTDNSAFNGGGGLDLAGVATLNVSDSTISGNRATGPAGHGGGINLDGGTLTLVNSTVSGNTSVTLAGGIEVSTATLNATASTITDNTTAEGGGIEAGGPDPSPVTLKGTIVAGNHASSGPDCAGTPIVSAGHNLLGTAAGCTFTGQSTDLVGQDPQLGPLANNGGPTQTHALAKTSPAVNNGDAPPSDQRGVPRTAPDIGAYEYAECLGVTVTLVGTQGDDLLSAVRGAHGVLAFGGDDTVQLSRGNDAVCAGAGNDHVALNTGRDKASGGAGRDEMHGGAHRDTLTGGPGKDLLYGAVGNDKLAGGAGPDRLSGGEGADSLLGNGGNDFLLGGKANDRLAGGSGKRDRCLGATGSRDKAKPSCEKSGGIP